MPKDIYGGGRFSFVARDLCNIDNLLDISYDLVISFGVFMYLNDDKLAELLSKLNRIRAFGVLCLQATVSLMTDRLTLNEFYSKEMASSYSSIYRTVGEYNSLFATHLGKRFHLEETGLLDDVKEAYNNETNLYRWVFTERG